MRTCISVWHLHPFSYCLLTEFKLSSFEVESERRLTEGRTQSFKRFAKEIKTVNSKDPFLRRKTSLRKVQDEDDVITEVLLKKPSVKISCVKQDSRRSFSGNDKDPSKTNLTISNSLQSTKTSRSSLSGYNGRNEVRSGMVYDNMTLYKLQFWSFLTWHVMGKMSSVMIKQ